MRICICDDHRLFADALTTLLEHHGHQVVAWIEEPTEMTEAVEATGTELCVMDLHFECSAIDTYEVISRLRAIAPVVVLTGDSQATEARALAAGAAAWATKTDRGDSLVRLIERIHAGASRPLVVGRATSGSGRMELLEFLTAREIDVLRGLVNGSSTSGLAVQLGVRPATVRAHLQSLFTKLGVHSRLQAVAFALDHGLIEVPSEPISFEVHRGQRPAPAAPPGRLAPRRPVGTAV